MCLPINNNWRITKFRECGRKQKKKNYHLFRQSASKTSTQATSYSRFQAIRYMRCYLISVTVFQALYLSCFIGTYYGTKNVMQRFPLTLFYKQFSFFICLLYIYYVYVYIYVQKFEFYIYEKVSIAVTDSLFPGINWNLLNALKFYI